MTIPTPHIDHLIVAARTLEEGRVWLEEKLGAPLQPGGQHKNFGTHNMLLSLGPDEYIELLAINHDVPKPGPVYPLGFELPWVQEKWQQEPFLLHWIARVDNLEGEGVQDGARDQYRWRSLGGKPGELVMDGVKPSLIHWITPPPFLELPDSGVRLKSLRLGTPDVATLQAEVDRLGLGGRVQVFEAAQATINATFTTPKGEVTL